MNKHSVNLREGTVGFDQKGGINLIALNGREPFLQTEQGHLWEVVMQEPSDGNILGKKHLVTSATSPDPTITETPDGLKFVYSSIGDESRQFDVELTIDIETHGDSISISATLANRESASIVREIHCPVVRGIDPKATPCKLLWPNEAGERYDDPTQIRDMRITYPKEASMQFVVVDRGDHGLYVGSHDSSFQATYLNAYYRNQDSALDLSITKIPYLLPGEEWKSAPSLIRPYQGQWHVAADFYRRWANTWWKPLKRPAAAEDFPGWQLVIMKQQNGEIIWNYDDIDLLRKLGETNGLNFLGLFGWTAGGHDRHYPRYIPDPAMGGEKALAENIRRARDAGTKVILYVNGQLMDVLGDFFPGDGKGIACLSERGEPFLEMWQKYRDAPARVHAYGCQSTEGWRAILLSLAEQAQKLGASGILYDQIGSPRWPLCFSREHDHDRPGEACGPGVVENLRQIQEHMHRIDPDFLIMTEHICDCTNMHIDLTHGSGAGFRPHDTAFPALFRYTFPEYVVTQRHKTPVIDPKSANFGLRYGMRPEVEYRYGPDRSFVEHGIRPSFKDYEAISENEGIQMMQDVDLGESLAHLSKLIRFQRDNRDLLWSGRFIDTVGIRIQNNRLQVTAFESEAEIGILLMNPTDDTETPAFELQHKRRLIAVSSLDGPVEVIDSPLAPGEIRLYRYR